MLIYSDTWMKRKGKKSVSAGIILIKKYQLKMFPLLDYKNLLIKKSTIFFLPPITIWGLHKLYMESSYPSIRFVLT